MKHRTLQVASAFTCYVGTLLGIAIMVVAVCETMAGVCLLVASEREE